jgi:hypothetical protein
MLRHNAGDTLWIYTIYDRPRDYPDRVVVRPWVVVPGSLEAVPLKICRTYETVEQAREACRRFGLYKLDRQPGDDPCIVETWL